MPPSSLTQFSLDSSLPSFLFPTLYAEVGRYNCLKITNPQSPLIITQRFPLSLPPKIKYTKHNEYVQNKNKKLLDVVTFRSTYSTICLHFFKTFHLPTSQLQLNSSLCCTINFFTTISNDQPAIKLPFINPSAQVRSILCLFNI